MVTACTRCPGGWPQDLKFTPGAQPVCGPCYIELALLDAIPQGSHVLDVGAGLGRYGRMLYDHTGGHLTFLDAHLETLTARKIPDDISLLVGDLRVLLPMIRDDTFDVVTAIDLIEHLPKADGQEAILQMLRIAQRVVLFTPDGFMPQEEDAYGLGNTYQRHLSGWTQDELLAFGRAKVTRIDPFHETGEAALLAVLDRPS